MFRDSMLGKNEDPEVWINSLEDLQCSAIDINSNETIKCNKWIYDKSQMKSTIIIKERYF